MQIVPNLHYNGDCEKAIELYEQAFKAQRTVLLRYRDANPADRDELPVLPDERHLNDVYHCELLIGGQRVILNDHIDPIARGQNVSLMVALDRKEDVLAAYEILKEGATIIMPLHETTYSACLVSLVDRYGVRWELIKEI